MTVSEPLLPATFLFRFAVPLQSVELPSAVGRLQLNEEYRLPCFAELDGRPMFADLRAAWHPLGLAFTAVVTGKRQPVWCRAGRLEDSDALHLWIDTRDAHNIHRASRFCHHFVALPAGDGRDLRQPIAELVPIHRAKENPRPVAARQLAVAAQVRSGGYAVQLIIPGRALTGYDPQEHPRLGFSYAVVDRELGWQTFSVGPEFPLLEDPSLWGTLELVGSQQSAVGSE